MIRRCAWWTAREWLEGLVTCCRLKCRLLLDPQWPGVLAHGATIVSAHSAKHSGVRPCDLVAFQSFWKSCLSGSPLKILEVRIVSGFATILNHSWKLLFPLCRRCTQRSRRCWLLLVRRVPCPSWPGAYGSYENTTFCWMNCMPARSLGG